MYIYKYGYSILYSLHYRWLGCDENGPSPMLVCARCFTATLIRSTRCTDSSSAL